MPRHLSDSKIELILKTLEEYIPSSKISSLKEAAPTEIDTEIKATDNPLLKRSILNKIIFNSENNTKEQAELVRNLQVEVQHNEVVEQEISQQVHQSYQHATQQTIHQNAAYQSATIVNDFADFEARLIGVDEFTQYNGLYRHSKHPHKNNSHLWSLIKRDIFNGLLFSIKYFSESAAQVVANHIEALATFNLSNLPTGFSIKKAKDGGLVLDYEEFSTRNTPENPFTPSLPLAPSSLPEDIDFDLKRLETLQKWQKINHSALTEYFLKHSNKHIHNALKGLWGQFGDEGIITFFSKLIQILPPARQRFHDHKATQRFNDSIRFIYNYLSCFESYEEFMYPWFFDCLHTICHYDEVKFQLLSRFLENTFSSKTDLRQILSAFELFYSELSHLSPTACQQLADREQSQWKTPTGGNPIVYMERMLTILQNAQNIDEQIQELHTLELNNYGGYYASKFEGFKLVSAAMNLEANITDTGKKTVTLSELFFTGKDFDLLHFNQKEFKSSSQELDKNKWLLEQTEILETQLLNGIITEEEKKTAQASLTQKVNDKVNYQYVLSPEELSFYREACCRYLGQHTNGITLKEFNNFVDNYAKYLLSCYDPQYSFSKVKWFDLLTILIFATHERYNSSSKEDKIPKAEIAKQIQSTLKKLYNVNIQPIVMLTLLKNLINLNKLGINFTLQEGDTLVDSISNLNSCEFQSIEFETFFKNQTLEELQNNAPREPIQLANNERYNCKAHYITKLFYYFQYNKYGMLRFLQNPYASRWIHLCLDAVSYFDKYPAIATNYKEELPLFSFLINCDIKYYEGCIDQATKIGQMQTVAIYLNKAASNENTVFTANFSYFLKSLLDASKTIPLESFLKACQELTHLSNIDIKEVDNILIQYNLIDHKTTHTLPLPDYSDDEAFRSSIIESLIKIELFTQGVTDLSSLEKLALREARNVNSKLYIDLNINPISSEPYPIEYLFFSLKDKLNQDQFFNPASTPFLLSILSPLQSYIIYNACKAITDKSLRQVVFKILKDLPDFAITEIQKFRRIEENSAKLVSMIRSLASRNIVLHFDQTTFIKMIQSQGFTAEKLDILLSCALTIVEKNYLNILLPLTQKVSDFTNDHEWASALDRIYQLTKTPFTSEQIQSISEFYAKHLYEGESELNLLNQTLIKHISRSPAGAMQLLATTLLKNRQYQYQDIKHLVQILDHEMMHQHPQALCDAIADLNKSELLSTLLRQYHDQDVMILRIILKAYSHSSGSMQSTTDLKVLVDLIDRIRALPSETKTKLIEFYNHTILPIASLSQAVLSLSTQTATIDQLLQTIERNPFGPRPLKQQFSTNEVERVVNHLKDLSNQPELPAKPISFLHRKKLMEACLFINQAGYQLPTYPLMQEGKLTFVPAKDLPNHALKALFHHYRAEIQAAKDPETKFQARLLALGIAREVMYRTTTKMPNSTQMIIVIESMMAKGDHVLNIDTGAGKSLTTHLQAAILWLDGGAVDKITSSVADCERDIKNFGLFFNYLGIPYTKQPILSTHMVESYLPNGINYSILGQMSLFLSKAYAENQRDHLEQIERISCVIDEIDANILDDHAIYRYSQTTASHGIPKGQEWIYKAINQYVRPTNPAIRAYKTDEEFVRGLRSHLLSKTLFPQLIQRFTDEQLFTWMMSSIAAQTQLKEKRDYVLIPCSQQDQQRDTPILEARILLADGRIAGPETQWGNGVHQFLYAYLDEQYQNDPELKKQFPSSPFIIKPESKTIDANNSKVFWDHYQKRTETKERGFIWGSTATAGSALEIKEQSLKYGFEFIGIPPHKPKKGKYASPVIAPNQDAQFKAILNILRKAKPNTPWVLFCKDITTAEALASYLASAPQLRYKPLQLYTGHETDEATVIEQAKSPGMITITTPILTRNTHIDSQGALKPNGIATYISEDRPHKQRDGRIDRYHTPGTMYYIFNQEDLGGKDPLTFKQTLEEEKHFKRRQQEPLYDLLYLLKKYALQQPAPTAEAYQKRVSLLANLIKELETAFTHHSYAEFVKLAVDKFNAKEITPIALKLETLQQELLSLQASSSELSHYQTDSDFVTLKHCIPAEVIRCSYGMLPKLANTSQSLLSPQWLQDFMLQGIKTIHSKARILKAQPSLSQLLEVVFEQAMNPALSDHQRQAYAQLLSNSVALSMQLEDDTVLSQTIPSIAQHYFAKLKENFNAASAFRKSLFGFTGMNALTTNVANITLLQQSFKHSKLENLSLLKEILNTMLEEYLQTSWFVNAERKQQVQAIKTTLENTTSLQEIADTLMQYKIDILKADNDLSAHKIKPVNFMGHSRLQESLDNMLTATTMFESQSAKHLHQPHQLTSFLETIETIAPENAKKMQSLTPLTQNPMQFRDQLQHTKKTLSLTGKNGNTGVIVKSMEKLVERIIDHQSNGMVGR